MSGLIATPREFWNINKYPDMGSSIRVIDGRLYVRAEIAPGGFFWIEILTLPST